MSRWRQAARRNLSRIRGGIGAGRDHDGVLAAVVDGDDGDARGALPPRHRGEVDPAGDQLVERHLADVVIADRADEADLCPGAARGQRLVRALAAGDQRIVRADARSRRAAGSSARGRRDRH